ncbi:MAG: T9SS type A sorting domain-containing protein [Crocinitomicaceae bacterium]
MIRISTFLMIVFFSGTITAQTIEIESFEYDGEMREYRLYIPEIYDGTEPVPLVFNLHGYGSNNVQQEAYGDFRPVADTANFIICHPQGLPDDLGTNHWNCFGTSSVDDVGFISALIDTIYSNYNIYGNQIYSTGMSNGGFMSYKLACLLSGRIAAVASVTGSITPTEYDDCITNHPMPVMQIHGTEDPTVPYDGGFLFMPIEDVVDHWVTFNECDTEPIVTEVPDTDPDDGCTATHYLYDNGLMGSTVEFYKINGGEHTWPGSEYVTSVTNNDFNASVEIWRFFRNYTLNELTSSVEEEEALIDLFTVYPNPLVGEKVNLRFNTSAEKTIVVHNALGQVVYQTKTTGQQLEFDGLKEAGLYFLSVSVDDQQQTVKLVRN